jgi:hypothetical protein
MIEMIVRLSVSIADTKALTLAGLEKEEGNDRRVDKAE